MPRRRLGLRRAKIGHAIDGLAVQVVLFDPVGVEYRDPPHTRPCEKRQER